MQLEAERLEVIRVGRAMYDKGLVVGTWGNVSRRKDNLIAITPSGMDYLGLTPEDIVIVDLKGNLVEGKWKPSTEVGLHARIYELYPQVGAIVHVHSPYASAFAVAGKVIPPVLEETAQLLGGEVRVAAYAKCGSSDLARNAADALQDRQAVLLANHGLVGVGKDGQEALNACLVAEKSAMVSVLAGQIGQINVLGPEEVSALRAGFASYGQKG